ncbi:MAG: type II toxin-antitoxin system VapC family toxin [Bacteroidales bacterium]|nr:type II toxin-antitoxin system VapC family toxin [Bacteroidales bacterium]MCF8458367.1 type II toxin-antitoxin system VapC family toxin [Bacteroidales bacterium]
MEIESFIIDTNAYSEFKRGNKKAIEIIQKSKTIFFTPIVVGELLFGFSIGRKSEQNLIEFKEFQDSRSVKNLIIDTQTSEFFAIIYKQLRTQGTPIPTNDMWIASLAMQYDYAVFTFDKHFNNIDGIKIIRDVIDLK